MRVDIGDGVRLFFDVEGPQLVPDGASMREKPVMLLLHGGPGFDHSLFKPWWSAFTDAFAVVYLDHRGQGRSDQRDDSTGWNLDTWADDVARFCETLEIEHPVVVGNSFGGMVAMHCAARHPDLPSKLVLSSTAAKMDVDAVVAAFRGLGGEDAASIAAAFWSDPTDDVLLEYLRVCIPLYTQHDDGLGPEAQARVFMNLAVTVDLIRGEQRTMDLRAGLGSVRCPTLVLAGELDPVCPLPCQDAILTALPDDADVRYELMADCGHGTYRDQPERTMQVLREFLDST